MGMPCYNVAAKTAKNCWTTAVWRVERQRYGQVIGHWSQCFCNIERRQRLINVYCANRGWLFEDLKRLISSCGAVASKMPINGAKAYICIRTNEAKLSPAPTKTLVQVHDMQAFLPSECGVVSFVHERQEEAWKAKGFKGECFTLPIGARNIPVSALPQRPTLGYFCREVGRKKRSDLFLQAVRLARGMMDFDVLMIGQNLEHVAHLGKYERRAAMPADYARITAFMTTSVSPMIPLSAYESLAAGRPVVTTTRIWPGGHDWNGVFTADTEMELAEQIVNALAAKGCRRFAPYSRDAWAKEQVRRAGLL